MKVYTRTGDKGKTGLFSGERIAKADPQIEAYGTVDELNSLLGVLASMLPEPVMECRAELQRVQSELLTAGAWLATTPGSASEKRLSLLPADAVQKLETAIDRMEVELPSLKAFILPGGHTAAAQAHVARTVCRRAERRVVGLLDLSPQGTPSEGMKRAQIYLNRLSDYLFVLARHINHRVGEPDILCP